MLWPSKPMALGFLSEAVDFQKIQNTEQIIDQKYRGAVHAQSDIGAETSIHKYYWPMGR